jgi:hypothetical protein
MPQDPRPTPRNRVIGIATALMCALAAGAVWALLSLYSRGDLAAFAFAAAAPVVWSLRRHGLGGRWPGAIAAGLCVTAAAVYAYYLQAVAQVASSLGLSMRDTLVRMAPGMAFDIARAGLDVASATTVGVAILAAVAATRWRGPARRD